MAKLTAIKIRSLTKPGSYGDGQGLYLQVQASGARSWFFRYMRAGRRRELGLGRLDTGDGEGVTLAAARDQAAEQRRLLRGGVDPIEARRSQPAATPDRAFEAVALAYIEAHEPSWRNKKHRQQWRNTLSTYAYPVIGKKDVAAVTTDDVLRILRPLWATKRETANRLRERIERVLDAAKVRGLRSGENPARWRGHLSLLLAKRTRETRSQHHAAMPWATLPAFMAALAGRSGRDADALAFTILTAARTGETLGATYGEFDRAKKVWRIPGERMKGGRDHLVPLSNPALALLKRIWPDEAQPEDRLFPLSNMAMAMLLRRMKVDVTVHGFRSTFRTWLDEATDYAGDLGEAALAHVKGDKTEAAYARGTMFEKRRALMDDWATYACSKRSS